ncbi:MAG TPA: hypothetical protein VIW01_14185, partial [Dehalococcoidia bacterium]
KKEIAAASDGALAAELVDAFEEMKLRYFRADFRPSQLEAGRFAEAAWRILQLAASGKYTPIGKTLPRVQDLLLQCEGADPATTHESIRLHIPRALAAVYNVRNRRDVGHIAADVDANHMDAEHVVGTCKWVLAEFVRLFHGCPPGEAQAYVEAIVQRPVPLVQVFGDGPFILRPDLSGRDEILVTLYHQGTEGANLEELDRWLRTIDRRVIAARISELERSSRYVRRHDGRVYITEAGSAYVEQKLLTS